MSVDKSVSLIKLSKFELKLVISLNNAQLVFASSVLPLLKVPLSEHFMLMLSRAFYLVFKGKFFGLREATDIEQHPGPFALFDKTWRFIRLEIH